MRPTISAAEATLRLLKIFPRAAFDTVMSGSLAGSAAASLIFVDAIWAGDVAVTYWARPSTVLWMSEQDRTRNSIQERLSWRESADRGRSHLNALVQEWGTEAPTYAENTRETLRDDTFRRWREVGAIRERVDVPKNSSKGRWALEPHFAALFDPTLSDEEFEVAATKWRDEHLSPQAKLRVRFAADAAEAKHAVTVTLPSGQGSRKLEAGQASLILKGVIEDWAPHRLLRPYVITISEPGNKLFTADAHLLKFLGLSINVSDLLPDALIADLRDDTDSVEFWFIEAVNTAGEINEVRRQRMIAWAEYQGIQSEQCRFLTAFSSRHDGPARKLLKDLASGSYAYYADEPGYELAWYSIGPSED